MADRGALSAIQNAQAVPQGVFAHVMEPTAAFPGELTARDASPVAVDLEAYQHPFDGPAGASDFTDQFTVDRTGTGYFMQPADDTQDALNALANGRSQVVGALTIDMPLAEALAGSSAVDGLAGLTINLAGGADSASTLSVPALARVLEGQGSAAASSGTSAPLLGLLRYRDAVLASNPAWFLHFDELSGQDYFNDPALGGQLVATGTSTVQFQFAAVTRRSATLVEASTAGSVVLGRTPSQPFNSQEYGYVARVASNQAALAPQLEYTIEFWTLVEPGAGLGTFVARTALGRLEVTWNATTVFAFRSSVDNSNQGDGVILRSGALVPGRLDNMLPHHIVVSYTPFDATGNGEYRIFVDGVLLHAAQASTPHPSADPGTTWVEPPNFFKGRDTYGFALDEVAFYDHVLTEAEVAAHYNAAYFALKLAGTGVGASALSADLTYAGAEEHVLEGSAAGMTTVQGVLYDGATMELLASAAGTSTLAADLRHMRLNMSQAVTTPRSRVRFVRAKA